ncbi:hypothetical protein A8139_05650 [Marinomonas primoryensis]|uniref:HNH nuclease domain-containing protein n=1 Tax=Marinomonas primoryensis TaxID=178399 RepID=A0A2Z4PPT6_9GAMM|nr:HNH endonuclease signature motif containing protein [Marinomonas primoryensis]AWX99535.1 hypothetical protein A8139_05650 [Marinomonas primoryensis]
MKKPPIPYSATELAWVKCNSTLSAPELHAQFCQAFNRDDVSKDNIVSLRKRNGWKTGRTGHFEKGHVPSENARPKGPNKTSFKKGQRPHNHLEVGSKVLRDDGYLQMKIAEPNHWKLYHLHLWEKRNGAIPAGKIVSFIDGDKKNFKPGNFELINRKENIQINRLAGLSDAPEARQSVRLLGKLIVKTHEIQKSINTK